MQTLLESVKLVYSGSKKMITSTISGLERTIPLPDDKPVSEYIMSCAAGEESLSDFLVTGLVENLKKKTQGFVLEN